AEAGCWEAALDLLARVADPPALAGLLARALRAVPPLAPERAEPWLGRLGDEELARDGELALARAALYEQAGEPERALRVLRRALGLALVGQRRGPGRRLSAEIGRLAERLGEGSGAAGFGLGPAAADGAAPLSERALPRPGR